MNHFLLGSYMHCTKGVIVVSLIITRGSQVGPVLAKVFVMILESHISQWAETNDLHAKGQVGFRKDFRTINNLFILRTLTEQAKF